MLEKDSSRWDELLFNAAGPSVDLDIYGVPLKFSGPLAEQIPKPLLAFQATTPSPNAFEIHVADAENLGFSLGDRENANCFIETAEHDIRVDQRDFVGRQMGTQISIALSDETEDGFYNFLRWFLPRQLLKKNIFVLHSSAVLCGERAVISFGPSGAGKTTLSELAHPRPVLGDDLNLIRMDSGQLLATASPLGQRVQAHETFGTWYPVKALFWLEKSTQLEVTPLESSTQYLYLISSLANIFWSTLPEDEISKLQNIAKSIQTHQGVHVLKFPIQPTTWPFIEEALC